MIVGARMKARGDQALSVGWYSAGFARMKKIKPLADYLKPEPPVADKRASGAAAVAAMLRRLERKGIERGGI